MSASPRANGDHRPSKRQRAQGPEEANPGPVDHIFIADGVSAKKAGVKKPPLSCCECRRLKLKCDRTFPCASCKKRGCAEICPEGVLVSGKGTRFILANTEQLHNKIHEMSERIRILEDALGSLHHDHEIYVRRSSNLGYNPSIQGYSDDEEENVPAHPLLQPELLGIKSSMGLYTGSGANSQAAPKSNGSKDEGQAVPSNNYQMDVEPHRSTSEETSDGGLRNGYHHPSSLGSSSIDFAAQVSQLSNAFPLPKTGTQLHPNELEHKLAFRDYIRSQLPPSNEAERLWEQAKRNALWQ
ncbi:hypothetical protein BKA70DRAFT_1097541 [Coprinopsis sp. MPI-PUGE-AT-0042]|nr:hypothetical protein BKA70DRAFT_1097541 [Coprinopsis sp. MPI-PUGE-AT-0042]